MLLACFFLALQSFLFALVLVPAARAFGQRCGFMDAPDPRKIHAAPMVRCGGLGIFTAFMLALLLDYLLARWLGAQVAAGAAMPPWVPAAITPYLPNIAALSPRLLAIIGGATLMHLTGLLDDRFALPPLPKLALQIASAIPLIATGLTVKAFIPGLAAESLLTIAWVVLLTNSFNFLDNMNGLSSGTAFVCALLFFALSALGGEYFMMAILALLAGAIAGFLPFNFPRATVFMGDGGSLFLGYMLAAISAQVTYYQAGVPSQLPVIAPLLILGVPLFDTASVMFIRWRLKKPFMQGDQNHFSHRLVALGFGRTQAVVFIWLMTSIIGMGALNLRRLDLTGCLIALGQTLLLFVAIFILERIAKRRGQQPQHPPAPATPPAAP